ncbi:hypothetical protein [Corallococcus exiguus]|uniref:Uncharacterized protein n=1 Tax=Corallococcus exiguus TaxID=83462 RepID=A0A7X4YBT2_9BACT|nr:hypothetical protein [Corallococcus exiguus]NBC41367.1 hypothetical protein [Corallococcus exiguus]TNV66988.1 hypothetical protein FH620_03425 [Corallococcus exiguus]
MTTLDELWSAFRRDINAMPMFLADMAPHLQDLLAESEGASLESLFSRANRTEGTLLEALAWLWARTLRAPVAVARVDALDVAEGEVRLIPSGLQVANGVLNRGILVVAGDVEVGGEFGDGDVGSAAVVAGSLRCRLANVQGVLRVGGVLDAAQLVFANNDPEPLVAREGLRAPLTLLQLGRSLDVKVTDGLVVEDEVTPSQVLRLRALLPAAVFHDIDLEDEDDDVSIPLDEVLDVEALYASAEEGTLVSPSR